MNAEISMNHQTSPVGSPPPQKKAKIEISMKRHKGNFQTHFILVSVKNYQSNKQVKYIQKISKIFEKTMLNFFFGLIRQHLSHLFEGNINPLSKHLRSTLRIHGSCVDV